MDVELIWKWSEFPILLLLAALLAFYRAGEEWEDWLATIVEVATID